jgi:F0F1-type ATP synthase membrane subunit c/vacuolar-type H+-ATPase subunit K
MNTLPLTHGAAGDPRTGRACSHLMKQAGATPLMTNKTRTQLRTGLLLLAAFAIYTALGLALIFP